MGFGGNQVEDHHSAAAAEQYSADGGEVPESEQGGVGTERDCKVVVLIRVDGKPDRTSVEASLAHAALQMRSVQVGLAEAVLGASARAC